MKPAYWPKTTKAAGALLWTAAMLTPALDGARAQATSAGQDVPETPSLKPITVTARRSIEDRFRAPGALIVLDRREIAGLGAFSVSDVLRQLPGVQVSPAADGTLVIRMRGMDASATELLVDGQRAGSLPFEQLPAELVERIEVIRSPTAEFGGAAGGTVNIVLRSPSVERDTTVRLTENRVWGRNTGQFLLSDSGPVGADVPTREQPAALAAAHSPDDMQRAGDPDPDPRATDSAEPEALRRLQAVREQPWTRIVSVSGNGLLIGSDTARRTFLPGNVEYELEVARYRRFETAFLLNIAGRIGPSDQLALRLNATRSSLGGQTHRFRSGGALDSQEDFHYERHYLLAGLDWTHRFADSKLETVLSISQSTDRVRRFGADLPANGNLFVTPDFTFHDFRRQPVAVLKSRLTGATSSRLWSAGADFESRRLEGQSTATGGTADAQDTAGRVSRHALWAQNEWDLGSETTFTAGLRAEHVELSVDDPAYGIQRHWTWLQPSVHARTPLGERAQFKLGLARISRPPGIWDYLRRAVYVGPTTSDAPDVAGNDSLRLERGWTLDASFDRQFGTDGQAGVNLFYRQLDDALVYAVSYDGNRWLQRRINTGDAAAWGVEVDARGSAARFGLPPGWTFSFSASLLDSRMREGSNARRRMPGQARYLANLSIDKPMPSGGGPFGGVGIAVTGPSTGSLLEGSRGSEGARVNLDLNFGWASAQRSYWRISVYNVTNVRYRSSRTFILPGYPQAEMSSMRLTPRVYLTVGMRF